MFVDVNYTLHVYICIGVRYQCQCISLDIGVLSPPYRRRFACAYIRTPRKVQRRHAFLPTATSNSDAALSLPPSSTRLYSLLVSRRHLFPLHTPLHLTLLPPPTRLYYSLLVSRQLLSPLRTLVLSISSNPRPQVMTSGGKTIAQTRKWVGLYFFAELEFGEPSHLSQT